MKILIPTNFSKISIDALESAIEITKNVSNASYTFVHFFKADFNKLVHIGKDSSSNAVSDQCEQFLNSSKNLVNGKPLDMVLIEYTTSSELYKLLDSMASDLILMGTQEVERYENEKLIGENTKELIKNIHTPILCIRKKIESADFKKVVFASSLKGEQLDEFNLLAPLLKALDVMVELLFVVTPEKFFTTDHATKLFDKALDNLKYTKVKLVIYNEVGVAEGIISYANNHHADLLILPTKGRKGLDYFFNGSIAEFVLDETRMPAISILD